MYASGYLHLRLKIPGLQIIYIPARRAAPHPGRAERNGCGGQAYNAMIHNFHPKCFDGY
jgi:hypothetical protein